MTLAVQVWRVELEQNVAAVGRMYSLLAAGERTQADRFLYPRDRSRYIVAHAALHGVLCQTLARAPAVLDLQKGANGKPYLPGYPLHFNLSHAGSLALVAVSATRRLGVDLEPLRELPDALELATQFHPAELTALRASHPSPRAFFECWTRKEAFVKATGQGLSVSLSSFEVSFFPDPNPSLRAEGLPIPGWKLLNLTIPYYCAALVVEARNGEPEPHVTLQDWQFP